MIATMIAIALCKKYLHMDVHPEVYPTLGKCNITINYEPDRRTTIRKSVSNTLFSVLSTILVGNFAQSLI